MRPLIFFRLFSCINEPNSELFSSFPPIHTPKSYYNEYTIVCDSYNIFESVELVLIQKTMTV